MGRVRNANLLGGAIVLVVLLGSLTASGKVIYVDADAPGPFHTGSIWTYAYKHIQDALTEANFSVKPVVIHVAQGIYRPDETAATPSGTGDRYATFQLINGVTLKGGYAGNGQPDPDMRDFTIYETILSGDLNGDDGPDFTINGENSYNVITGSETDATAVLDGFTITAGNANGYEDDSMGGGMYNNGGSPTLTNCTFSGNSAGDGGGMNNGDSSSPTLSNCTFSKNSAETGGGGGMNNWGESSPVLTNCTFNKNLSRTGGGGMCNVRGCSPMLSNCTFSDNSAGWGGGGIDNYDNCNPTLANCTFSGNSATWDGGGLCNSTNSHPTITNCTFINNTAENYSGGGMNNISGSSPTLTNCIFTGNLAGDAGGGMCNEESSPILTNCTFSGNWATESGGGMSNKENSNPALINCILWGNTASSGGQIHKEDTCFVTITYSDIQGGWLGTGNINTDPCFADAFNGDYHLKSEAGRWNPDSETWTIDSVTSPCIDAGDPTSDWKAELWPHGCLINMGAYGGTPEASMSLLDPGSIADIDVDGQIGGKDTKLLIDKWLFEEVLLPEDLNRDGKVNFTDYAIFAYIRGLPSPASNPYPTDGAMSVSKTADLSWTASPYAVSYDVYFGTNNPPPFIGNQTTTTYDPGEMAYSTTYYWRIDAVGDAGKTNGLVWSFTTLSSPPPPPPP